MGRDPRGRPPLEGDQERLAGRLLGDVDVTEAADQRGDQAAVLVPEDALDLGGRRRRLGHGRTRIGAVWVVGAIGWRLGGADRGRQASGSDWKGRTSTVPSHAFEPAAA